MLKKLRNKKPSCHWDSRPYWLSRSSKVDDFHLIWKDVCHFLLVISSLTLVLSLTVSEIWPVFHWKTHIFPTPFNPQFENIPFAMDGLNFAHPSLMPMANYSCKTFSPTTYPLARVHPLQTDRQTDDNHANSSAITWVRSAKNHPKLEHMWPKASKNYYWSHESSQMQHYDQHWSQLY